MENEQKFINECIRVFLGSTDCAKLPELYESVNLSHLNKLISENDIAGLFYNLYLKKVFDKINWGPGTIELWKKASGKNSLKNTLYEKETLRITDRLKENDINYFYIKGFSTRKRCHDNDYINSSTDIDLFIKKEDYEKIKNILILDGYKIPLNYYINKIAISIPFDEFEKKAGEICFKKKEKSLEFIVDLQWDFIIPDKTGIFHKIYNLNIFYNFKRNDLMEIGGKKINVFPLELEFITMSFHYAFHHGFNGIKWLVEICLFIKKYEEKINFDNILKNADFNLKKILGIILMLAYDYNFKKGMSDEQKKLFCINNLLPFEYLFYRNMTTRLFNGKSNRNTLRLIKILLPYRISSSFSIIKEHIKFTLKNGPSKIN
ncbi:MAG: nucleotidyltransferase family protein [Cyanobacteria bacterium]|nr:nucleotidyltransferase family protein [Cyanobacteriota bacterium]